MMVLTGFLIILSLPFSAIGFFCGFIVQAIKFGYIFAIRRLSAFERDDDY